MDYRVEVPISNDHADQSFFEDMIRINFPDFTLDSETIRTLTPALNVFVTEFSKDEDVLLWIQWLVVNGYNFRHNFIA